MGYAVRMPVEASSSAFRAEAAGVSDQTRHVEAPLKTQLTRGERLGLAVLGSLETLGGVALITSHFPPFIASGAYLTYRGGRDVYRAWTGEVPIRGNTTRLLGNVLEIGAGVVALPYSFPLGIYAAARGLTRRY